MTQDQSELNKLIINMLLQSQQRPVPNEIDVDHNYEINRDLGIQPPPVDTHAPPYDKPFRPRYNWFGRPS